MRTLPIKRWELGTDCKKAVICGILKTLPKLVDLEW